MIIHQGAGCQYLGLHRPDEGLCRQPAGHLLSQQHQGKGEFPIDLADELGITNEDLLMYNQSGVIPLTKIRYSGTDLAPMYFRKGAHEGKRYTVDEVFYSYSGCRLHLQCGKYHVP